MVESNRTLRGHDFLPGNAELAKIPQCYETDELEEALTTVHLHYFTASADWWLVEIWQEDAGTDIEPPLWLGFGYTRFMSNPDGAEWGYISLNELESLTINLQTELGGATGLAVVERDLDWKAEHAYRVIPGIYAPTDGCGGGHD